MPERWKTLKLAPEGGLIENEDLLVLAETKPGSATRLVNYEVGLRGGYRKINGYAKFDSAVVPETGEIKGVFVFDTGVIACRGTGIYKSAGSGWTEISTDTRTGSVKYRAARYNFATPTIMMVDGVNKPARYEPAGTGYSVVTDAPANATCIAEFRQHIFLGVGTSLFFSQPTDDTGWNATLGAGEINIGQTIVNLYPFRDELYVFCRDQIYKITGTNLLNFELVPVTRNIGCVAADSVQELGGTVVFLGPDGVRPIAATERNNDVEIGSISRPIQHRITDMINNFGEAGICSCVVREKSQYRLFSKQGSPEAAEESEGVICGIRLKSDGNINYEWSQIVGFNPSCADSAYIGGVEYVVHGGLDLNNPFTDAYVYRQETGYSLDGSSMRSTYQTPDLTFGDPTIRKTIYKLSVYMDFEDNQTAAILVSPLLDYSQLDVIQPTAFSILGTDVDFFYDASNVYYDDASTMYADVAATVVHKNLVGSGMAIAFKFETDGINPPHNIRSFVVQYNVGGRR